MSALSTRHPRILSWCSSRREPTNLRAPHASCIAHSGKGIWKRLPHASRYPATFPQIPRKGIWNRKYIPDNLPLSFPWDRDIRINPQEEDQPTNCLWTYPATTPRKGIWEWLYSPDILPLSCPWGKRICQPDAKPSKPRGIRTPRPPATRSPKRRSIPTSEHPDIETSGHQDIQTLQHQDARAAKRQDAQTPRCLDSKAPRCIGHLLRERHLDSRPPASFSLTEPTGHRAIQAPKNPDIKTSNRPEHQNTKASQHPSTQTPRHSGTKTSRPPGIEAPGQSKTKTSRPQGAKKTKHPSKLAL